MNILLLIKRFDYGGAENHVCELANELVLSGHKVWLISSKGRQKNRLNPGVRTRTVFFYEWNIISLLFRVLHLLNKEHIEVIHAHQRFPILLACFVALFLNIPVVATVHGRTKHDLRSNFVRRRVAKVIVVNQNNYNFQIRFQFFANKLHFIPNGLIVSSLEENEVTLKTNNSGLNLYYICRLDDRHGKVLLKIIKKVWPAIVKKHPGSTLHIVGEGSGLKKVVQTISNKSNFEISSSVVFERYAQEVSHHYKNADLVMGVGRVVLESLSHGVPSLSVKYNHLGPIITRENLEEISYSNFVAINYPPLDSEVLLNSLEDFIARKEYYKQETAHLQQLVASRYNIRDTVKTTVELYRSVLIAQ